MIEHHTRLDGDALGLPVEPQDAGEVLARVDDQCLADGLATLRRSGAAWDDRHG